MHGEVRERLEEYLAGALKPADQRAVEAHLETCESCRKDALGMREVSQMFGALRSDAAWESRPGFYSAVMQRVEERKTASPSFAGLFSLDFAFGRRLVFSCLVTLAVLGSYLVMRETRYPQGPLPVTLIAEQDSPSYDAAPAPEAMLATLTAYVR